MRLVACSACRAHYDVSTLEDASFHCTCGVEVDATPRSSVDAPIHRCGSCGALVEASAKACTYCRASIARDGRRDLLCPECYAGNDEDGKFCTACGVEFRPQPIPAAALGLSCVDCEGAELEPRSVGGVTVHECPKCAGLWAAEHTFDELLTRAIARRVETMAGEGPVAAPRATGGNPVDQEVKYRRCPQCTQLMARKNFRRTSGVVVDQCPSHGTWLDANELEQIAGFILSGGLDRAAEAAESTMRTGMGEKKPDKSSSEFARLLMENRGPGSGIRNVSSLLDLFKRFVDPPNTL